MKHVLTITMLLVALLPLRVAAQQPRETNEDHKSTSIGIIISSNDEETVWNVFRLANYSLAMRDSVTVFLLGKGVEVEELVKTSSRMKEQVESFRDNHGSILACGTCLQSRKNSNPEQCSISTMSELYDVVRRNRIVLSF